MYLKKIPRDKKIPKINAKRFTQEGTAAANIDTYISYSTILAGVNVSRDDIISIYMESVRPVSNWSEINPSPPFFLIQSQDGYLGFHNFGTGGNYVVDIIVLYRDYS